MIISSAPFKRRRGEACQQCRNDKRKCIPKDLRTCTRCSDLRIGCNQLAVDMGLTRSEKYNFEGAVNTPDGDGNETDPVNSSTTISYHENDAPTDRVRKRSRSTIESKINTTKPATASQPNEPHKRAVLCKICERDPLLRNRVSDDDMVQCENSACKRWYHYVCLWYAKTQRQVLSQATGPEDPTLFFCGSCPRYPKGCNKDGLGQVRAELGGAMKRARQIMSSKSAVVLGEPEVIVDSAPRTSNTHLSRQQRESLQWKYGGDVADFISARYEKYQGFEEAKIHDLMRNIDQSIFKYNEELCDMINAFGDSGDESLKYPLKAWHLIDANSGCVTGQEWYNSSEALRMSSSCHAPITTSLRKITQASEGAPLYIDPRLFDLTFSQVHTALVSWFVIDVLEKFDIFNLPNMKPLRTMMASVNQFGEDRWPQMGKHVVREIMLRTWHHKNFEKDMLENKDFLMRKMESYMAPLTKGFCSLSHHRAELVELTIRLWSYLQPLGGMFHVIQPEIGSVFSQEQQKGFDAEGRQCDGSDCMKKTVLWVTRRGFEYREKSVDGPRQTLEKALVIVR